MRKKGLLCLTVFLAIASFSVQAQRYAHLIDQSLNEADLRYMPTEELNILNNEIIALKGAQTNKQGSKGSHSYSSFSSPQEFLSAADQANLDLIHRMKNENAEPTCSDQELFHLFFHLAKTRQNMPIYLAEKFYGVALNTEMAKHQKYFLINENIIAFWVPQFSADCEVCPYNNHFVTINQQSGKKMAGLKMEGLMSVLDENILEVKNIHALHKGTTTQPEYYQIQEDGLLISKGNQVVHLRNN